MRRLIPLFALATSLGCGSEHGPDGTLVKPGPGLSGLPGGSEGVNASHAVPISAGTLIVARDGRTAIASDPDRDRVFIVNLDTEQMREVALSFGDEPGRLAEDGAGRVHVATRSGGALVTIDLASATVLERRAVCSAPRGVAWDAALDLVHVACETGELVSLPASGGPATRTLRLERDLRDVVVQSSRLLVSRFKTAEVLAVDPSGNVTQRLVPPNGGTGFGQVAPFQPAVAWRMVSLQSGGVLVAHQRENPTVIAVGKSGYYGGGGPCTGSIVEGTVSRIDPDTASDPYVSPPPPAPALPNMIGPSDIAVSRDGTTLAVLSVGNSWGMANQLGPTSGSFSAPPAIAPKLMVTRIDQLNPTNLCGTQTDDGIRGEPTSVAFDGVGNVVVLSREPAQIQIFDGSKITSTIALSSDSRADTGIALFHMNSGFGIACASCHPEGREDGRTWQFADVGARRTQTVAGGVLSTAPFHWSGDMLDFTMLMHEVFESRMGGSRPNKPQIAKLEQFVDSISAPQPAIVNLDAAARGKAMFENEAGCASCHSGDKLTDNQTFDVGTRGSFQVPSLIGVGARAPYMHDGCAATLSDRFGPCGGGNLHGETLSGTQVDDMVAYLESL